MTINRDHWDEKINSPLETIMEFLLRCASCRENIGADLLVNMSTPFSNEYYDSSGEFSDKLLGCADLIRCISDCRDAGTLLKDSPAREIAHWLIYPGRAMVPDWSHFRGTYRLQDTVGTTMPRIVKSFIP